MKYIKHYEKDIFDLAVNQYVKIRNSSPFHHLAKDRIFKIYKKDNSFFFLKDLNGNTDLTFTDISKPNVRTLTPEEYEELEISLSQNKYNL